MAQTGGGLSEGCTAIAWFTVRSSAGCAENKGAPEGGGGLHVEWAHSAGLPSVGAGQHARAELYGLANGGSRPQSLHVPPRVLVACIHLCSRPFWQAASWCSLLLAVHTWY